MAKVHEEATEISLITSLEYGEIKNLNLYVGPVEVMTRAGFDRRSYNTGAYDTV